MSQEINRILFKLMFLEDVLHGLDLQIEVSPRLLIFWIDFHNKFVETGYSFLLKHSHQRRLHRLHIIRWHFTNSQFCSRNPTCGLLLDDVGCVYAFPFEILSDFCMKQHFNQFSVSHNKFRNQVHIPISIVAVLLRHILPGPKLLPHIRQIQRCRFAAIIAISVKVEHFLAVDGEEAGEDALLQSRSEHNDVV